MDGVDNMTEEQLNDVSPEKILSTTKSLYNYKLALRRLMEKHRSKPMTEADYATPEPLAVRAFKDGRNSFLEFLTPYLVNKANG